MFVFSPWGLADVRESRKPLLVFGRLPLTLLIFQIYGSTYEYAIPLGCRSKSSLPGLVLIPLILFLFIPSTSSSQPMMHLFASPVGDSAGLNGVDENKEMRRAIAPRHNHPNPFKPATGDLSIRSTKSSSSIHLKPGGPESTTGRWHCGAENTGLRSLYKNFVHALFIYVLWSAPFGDVKKIVVPTMISADQ
jgi:hypothetical protein